MARVDNIGAIFMASDIANTSGTKYMDIRYKYVNEYVQVQVAKILLLSLLTMVVTFSPIDLNAELHKKHPKSCK